MSKVYLVDAEIYIGKSSTRIFSKFEDAQKFCLMQNLKGVWTSFYEKDLLTDVTDENANDNHKEIMYSVTDGKYVIEEK